MACSTFLPRFKQRLLPFNPLDCFIIRFEIILIQFPCVSGFQSISGFLSILHWQGGGWFFIGRPPGQNVWTRACFIKQFGVACSAICRNNHCYRLVPWISIILCAQNRPVALWEGDLSHSEVYEGPLSYAEGNPLTLRSHFYSPV